jgi:hypothetical protein
MPSYKVYKVQKNQNFHKDLCVHTDTSFTGAQDFCTELASIPENKDVTYHLYYYPSDNEQLGVPLKTYEWSFIDHQVYRFGS